MTWAGIAASRISPWVDNRGYHSVNNGPLYPATVIVRSAGGCRAPREAHVFVDTAAVGCSGRRRQT
jgi:hypothetical protein